MRTTCFAAGLLWLTSCSPQVVEEKIAAGPGDIQGRWKIVHVTDPSGNAFEPSKDTELVVENDTATSEGIKLRMEFPPNPTYGTESVVKLYDKDKLVGEITVKLTVQPPIHMLWEDNANKKQETLLEKLP